VREEADGFLVALTGDPLKIAVLSDIHSNVYALDAVIADTKRRSVDVLVNLGDILYGPIAPMATFDLLQSHDILTIRGNQDRQICEAARLEIESNPTMRFVLEDLGQEPVDWMAMLPFDMQVTADIYACHGTPASDLIYLLENVESGYPRRRTADEIIELLNGQSSPVVLCGHTHIPRLVQLASGQMIVNPGSVGLPAYIDDEPCRHAMENHSPHASYAIIEKVGTGNWLVELVKVPYDVEQAVRAAKERGRQDWAHFLATGRVA
jgi:predicted phosphodiesterase